MFEGEVRLRDVVLFGVAMLAGSLVPVPFERRPAFERFGPDKLLHLLGHGVFAAGLSRAVDGRHVSLRTGLAAIVVSTCHGLVAGRLQRHVPGRAPERADVLAGLVGSIVGVALLRRQEQGEKSKR